MIGASAIKVEEKRLFPRMGCEILASKKQNILNVSNGGIYFETNEVYDQSQPLVLSLLFPANNSFLQFKATIVRSVSLHEDYFGYGLRFDSISSDIVGDLKSEFQAAQHISIFPAIDDSELINEKLPLEFYHYTDKEISRLQSESLTYLLTLYGFLALAITSIIPVWLAMVTIPLILPRFQLAIHELMHHRSARQVNPLLSLFCQLQSPIALGYREFRKIHIDHHQNTVTVKDPEWFQIKGGHWNAFLNALISPEKSFFSWVTDHGFSKELFVESSLRFSIFILVFSINPAAFFYYWIVMRLVYGAAQFLFHHTLHYRNGMYGTFKLKLSPYLYRLGCMWMGKSNMNILCEHDAHHSYSHVKAEHLTSFKEKAVIT